MTVSLEEATSVLHAAYPRDTPTITKTDKGSYKILDVKGLIIGAAFDLKTAVRQAVQPVLKREAERLTEEREAKQHELADFLIYLQEKHRAEFDGWREARRVAAEAAQAAAAPSNTVGTELSEVKLVQIT